MARLDGMVHQSGGQIAVDDGWGLGAVVVDLLDVVLLYQLTNAVLSTTDSHESMHDPTRHYLLCICPRVVHGSILCDPIQPNPSSD